ncbi:hypothetical protein [Paraburkholderia sp. MM5477-R1]|uniref:hypothetical protein n=1 Tax=Paraburkholderia sp. MM5477-R1 TaxID=2991062 RepID=UPI003D1E9922
MTTIPSVPARKTFNYPKLAVSATIASKSSIGFIFEAGEINAVLYACVTDIQGNSLPPEHLPPREHFKLFEIEPDVGIREVTFLNTGNALELPANVGALKQVIFQFEFKHTPTLSTLEQGDIRQVPFMLLVSPTGMFAPFDELAGYTLLSATVLNPYQ